MASKQSSAQLGLSVAFALLFGASGFLHFVKPAPFIKIVPPFLPYPAALVAISGAAELCGAIGLLLPQTRRYAALWLTALLLAVFPANIYMAYHSVQVTRHPLPAWMLWARLPLQIVLIGGVLWSGAPIARRQSS